MAPTFLGAGSEARTGSYFVGADGALTLDPTPDQVADWDDERRAMHTERIRVCVEENGGVIIGAFDLQPSGHQVLVGATVLDGTWMGAQRDTLDMYFLFASRKLKQRYVDQGGEAKDFRDAGIGGTLLEKVAAEAKARGAKNLYISASNSEHTINFYRRRGAVQATEILTPFGDPGGGSSIVDGSGAEVGRTGPDIQLVRPLAYPAPLQPSGALPRATTDEMRALLAPLIPTAADVRAWVGGPSSHRFPFGLHDAELGYIHRDRDLVEGIDGSVCTYRYDTKTGARVSIAHAEKPCRINTYGNSFTSCEQVSDGETWQEQLASHLGEPVRNFGIGGYSVYQAYRRMRREEARNPAGLIVFNIFDDDHFRSVEGCARSLCTSVSLPVAVVRVALALFVLLT